MIKIENIEVKIQSKNKNYYENIIGRKLIIGSLILVESNKIPKKSHLFITGICDFCLSEKKIKMKEYSKQTNNGLSEFSCSKNCSIMKTKKTNLKKYGVENVFQDDVVKYKSKEKKLALYGDENFNNIEKASNTNLKKYGFKTVLSDPNVREKIKENYYDKYGVYFPSQNTEVLEKMKLTTFNKYGVDNYSRTNDFKNKVKDRWFEKMHSKIEKFGILSKVDDGYTIKCNNCNNNFVILNSLMNKRILNNENICLNCNPINVGFSKNEKSLLKFITDSYDDEILENSRKVIDCELDIYLPDLKIGFEFNGLYWHSELYKHPTYHLNKTLLCIEKGIDLFHIWEDDWIHKNNIVKSMIMNKLGKTPNKIYARNCQIKEVNDNKVIKKFLIENHIQGFVGSKIKIGLFHNNVLVSLMTFGNLRKSLGQKSKEGSYELLRFCNKINTNVIGGASKLFKFFINNYRVDEVISYSDYSRSNGNLYKTLGFKLSHNSTPNYYYIVDGKRIHRFNFRKDKLIKDGFDPNKTEVDIMNERGYYRIFDCGMQKWIYKLID